MSFDRTANEVSLAIQNHLMFIASGYDLEGRGNEVKNKTQDIFSSLTNDKPKGPKQGPVRSRAPH